MGKISNDDLSKVANLGSKSPSKSIKKPEFLRSGEKKERDCLMCREPFVSTWAGERICSKCKRSAVWRHALSES